MPARTPEETDILINKAVNDGDLEAAVDLYEADARFVAGPDNVVSGTEALRAMWKQVMDSKPSGTIQVKQVIQTGDLALLLSEWTSTSTGADGKQSTSRGQGREVV